MLFMEGILLLKLIFLEKDMLLGTVSSSAVVDAVVAASPGMVACIDAKRPVDAQNAATRDAISKISLNWHGSIGIKMRHQSRRAAALL